MKHHSSWYRTIYGNAKRKTGEYGLDDTQNHKDMQGGLKQFIIITYKVFVV